MGVPLYDLIENNGIEYVLSLPQERIQAKFRNTPNDELIYYMITGLRPDELVELVSSSVLKSKMKQLNYFELFDFISYLDNAKDVSTFFDSSTFIKKFLDNCPRSCYRVLVEQPKMFRSLLDHNYLTPSVFVRQYQDTKLDDIIKMMKRIPAFSYLFKPLLTLVEHSIFPVKYGTSFNGERSQTIVDCANKVYSKDMVGYIMNFLV